MNASTQSGFTLLEVLVAVVVLSLGLLGLAGLQVATLRNNQIAYYRGIAVQQAYDMADRIRANQIGARNGAYDNLDALTPADPDCLGNSCTPAQIAVADHAIWNGNNGNILPGGVGTVSVNADGAFLITVSWNENTELGSVLQSFETTVVP